MEDSDFYQAGLSKDRSYPKICASLLGTTNDRRIRLETRPAGRYLLFQICHSKKPFSTELNCTNWQNFPARKSKLLNTSGVGGHGLVVDIDSGVAGPTVMLRADIDALPYADPNDPERIEAIHACGHDAHAAILLAAAPEIRKNLKKGKIRLAFQPAEESLQGALAMIKDGVLDGVDIVVGSHIRPVQDLPFGKYCASVNHVACATVEVRIDGKQAHAARPHLGINPIEAASQYIASVGLIKIDPNKSWSVKPTQIHSEVGATNSIPSFVKIAYDLRAQDNAALEAIIGRMKLAAAGLEGSFGAKASCEVTEYCPGPEYDEALGELFKETVAGTFGKEALGANCGGGGEDFHFYKKAKPELRVLYYGIGSGAAPGLHDRNMNFKEEILPQASQLLINLVAKILA